MTDKLFCKVCGKDVPDRRHRRLTCTVECYDEHRAATAMKVKLDKVLQRHPLLPSVDARDWARNKLEAAGHGWAA